MEFETRNLSSIDTLRPDRDEIHVWRIDLRVSAARIAADAALLDKEEARRAARYMFEIHRQGFIAAHGALRRILGRYLHIGPRRIAFVAGPHGKPRLATGDHLRLQFNLSHSGDYALAAVAARRVVGVDIEQVRPLRDLERLAAAVLTDAERNKVVQTDGPQRTAAFFHLWTRKEALLKAIGGGLSIALKEWDVTGPRARSAAAAVRGTSRSWYLWDLASPAGYRAALAADGVPASIRLWRFATDPEA